MRSDVLHVTIAEDDLVGAFPRELVAAATKTVQRLRSSDHAPTGRTPVSVADETVFLPYRIYNDPSPKRAPLPVPSPVIWDCLFSCHHDGYERERAIRRSIASGEPLVVPFVVQLLGGYPIEIHRTIDEALTQSSLDDSVFVDFAATNPEFMVLTHARAVSYRSAYYWSSSTEEYPALRLLDRWMSNTSA